MSRLFWTLLAALFLAISFVTFTGGEGGGQDLDAVHHVADGNYLDFEPFGKVELPRILLVRRADGSMGLDAFLTTHSAVASEAYVVVPEEAETAEPNEASAEGIHDSGTEAGTEEEHGGEHAGGVLAPVSGELLVDLSITRHLVFIWLGALIVFLIFRSLARRYERGVGRETAPRGVFHNLFESLVIFVRDEIARPNLGDKTDRFLPYLLTAFTLIYTCNLLGLVPFGSTATSNISVTAVLATFTFIITQVSANREHWSHLLGPPGTPLLVRFILFPVEFLGLFTKPIALAIRLFANMTAGHLVILSLIGLIFLFAKLFGPVAGYGISVVSVGFAFCIFLLELLVATIQAYIFTMLSALFIGMAVADHDHHHEDHGTAGHREAGAPAAEPAMAA
jgi:F-type H+-transporting ATPase subunit a